MSIKMAWRIAKLEKDVQSLKDELSELKHALTATERPAKRGPGRPPKIRQPFELKDNANTN